MSMEKYTLEAFEKYPMMRCRPQEVQAEPSQFVFHTVPWDAAGPVPENSLLEIGTEKMDALSSMAREERVIGFTIPSGTGGETLWECAVHALPGKRFFVPVDDSRMIQWAREKNCLGGLLVSMRDNPYDAAECMARQGLQKCYREVPVLVRGGKQGQGAMFAGQWHASLVEGLPGTCAGWRIALRRMTCPKAVTAGGFVPMRFWWTNRGPAFFHEPSCVRLRLRKEGETIPLALCDRPARIALGDRVYNEIIRLPDITPCNYTLEVGLFSDSGRGLTLCHADRTSDGFYPAGTVCVDETPRPEYEHIWDDYYADGYYPLVDPPVPGT